MYNYIGRLQVYRLLCGGITECNIFNFIKVGASYALQPASFILSFTALLMYGLEIHFKQCNDITHDCERTFWRQLVTGKDMHLSNV